MTTDTGRASPGQDDRSDAMRWLAFGSCVLAGLTNEVSGGALSLSLRPTMR